MPSQCHAQTTDAYTSMLHFIWDITPIELKRSSLFFSRIRRNKPGISQVWLNSHPISCNFWIILVWGLIDFTLLQIAFGMTLDNIIFINTLDNVIFIFVSSISFLFHFSGKYQYLCVCSGKNIHVGQNAQYCLRKMSIHVGVLPHVFFSWYLDPIVRLFWHWML